MALVCRFSVFALALTVLIGCETIPQHEALDTYPASGPTGIRTGISYARNLGTDSDSMSSTYGSGDSSDYWENGLGFNLEIPVDYNPYLGGFFGIGYDRMQSEDVTVGSIKRNIDDLQLLPLYIGGMVRYPFWLDKEKWDEQTDPIWLPNDPKGPAVYGKLLAGAAALLDSPQIRDTGVANGVRRALDRQFLPFAEADIGVEYRFGRVGTWCEVGYRQYWIINRKLKDEGFNPKDMGCFRTMVGLSFYLW